MKRIIVLLCFWILAFGSISFASTIYPDHLNDNPNYILVDGHMGTAWYLDRSSLVVQKYAPPQYIIAVNIVTVHNADKGNTTISNVETRRFFYNWDLKQMYWDVTGHDGWRYLRPIDAWYKTGIVMPTGEMAFYLAYNKKFYGSRQWYNSYGDSYSNVFTTSFYERVY